METYDDWDNRIKKLKEQLQEDSDSEIEYPVTHGFLRNDLDKYDIKNSKDYHMKKKELESKKILRFTSDLDLDSESRLYGNKICFQRRFIQHKEIYFRNTQEITFANSIIDSDIYISGECTKPLVINFDNSIFLGKIKIYASRMPYEISIETCNIKELVIENCSILTLSMSYSRLFKTSIDLCKINNFHTQTNSFDFFTCINNDLKEVKFSHHQLNTFSIQNKTYSKYKQRKLFKEFDCYKRWNKFDADVFYSSDEFSHLKTLEFIEKYCRVDSDRNFKAKLKKEMTYLSQSNFLGKILMKLLASFTSSFRILTILFLVYILFSFLYTIPIFTFEIDKQLYNGLSLSDSFYFSGITFLTIGYGEITPTGITRLFAILEGGIGIIGLSSFLVALLRKYID